MERFCTILSRTIVNWRLNPPQWNRYNQLARPFSIRNTFTRHTSLQSLSFKDERNHCFLRCVEQYDCHHRPFASEVESETPHLSQNDFEHFCAETLESLTDYFDEVVEKFKEFEAADVVYKDGVLTVNLGKAYGTYVINKQTPNKQIWLSSPRSGPKRFDYVPSASGSEHGYWIYKHTGVVLHELLDKEMAEIVSAQTGFQQLPFGLRQ